MEYRVPYNRRSFWICHNLLGACRSAFKLNTNHSVTFHDKLARPARVRIVEAFIARAQREKGVWFARKDELARFVLDSPTTIREAEAT